MKVYNPEGKIVHNNAGFSIKVLEKYMQEGTIIDGACKLSVIVI